MNNLLKMERYQLVRNRFYWYAMVVIFLLGFITAETYVSEVLGPGGGAAGSLTDILDGMVYDSTFLLIIISCVLAFILGQEFSGRTINLEVCSGHSRLRVFTSKVIVYLAAFNAMALIYPIAGCIRELGRFGIGDFEVFLYHLGKAVICSFLMNSVVLLIPVLCCFCFRNTAKAIALTAIITFTSSLYLGYGMMLHLPIVFLPTYQIRKLMVQSGSFSGESMVVAVVWSVLFVFITWKCFRRSELK
jgi:ABC-2 type transport system permease protein